MHLRIPAEIKKKKYFLQKPCSSFLRRGKVYFSLTLFLLQMLFFTTSCVPVPKSGAQEVPIEPIVVNQEGLASDAFLKGRFSILNTEMKVYALDISRSGNDILFSSDVGSVNMLNDRGRLRWEIYFEGLPVCAQLTPDGEFAAVGTDQGEVILMDNEGRILWKTELDGAVDLLAVAPGGENVAVSSKKNEETTLRLYDYYGNLLWERATAPLLEMILSPAGLLYYLEEGKKENTLVALNEKEEKLWSLELEQVSFSQCGLFAAASSGDKIYYYSLQEKSGPIVLWSTVPQAKITWLGLTIIGNNVVAYSSFSGSRSNLFVYNESGTLLWEKKIPSGALLETSRFGRRIVASSWQEYSEDFSKVLVLGLDGDILQEIEMVSRIKKMALSDDGSILALAGSDGNIFVLDISCLGPPEEGKEEENIQDRVLYSPVAMGAPAEEQYLTLFFFDERALHFVPVNRTIKAASKTLQTAVSELIKGPRRSSGLLRTIPKDVVLKTTLEEGLVFVDLPEELNRLSGSTQVIGIIESLLLTISQFTSVEGVRFLIAGEETGQIGTEGFYLENIFLPRRWEQDNKLFFLPYQAGDRYYLLPREAIKLEEGCNTPALLVNILLKEYRKFLPQLPEVKKVHVAPEEIILDWDSSFKNIFSTTTTSEQRELIALFVDSLLLTLTNNLQADRLVFFVEGVPWKLPEEFAYLNLELKHPYYINPE